jgi:hypothetical protein
MAGVVVTMDGDETRLFRAMQKVLEKQNQMNEKFKEGGNASEDAGRKSSDSWSKTTLSLDTMKAGLISYASGLASVAGAVGVIQMAWQQVRKEQEAGLTQLQRTQGQDRRLLQISGSAQEFDQLRSQADQLASQFGVDRAVVREVIFSAVSENFRDAVPAIIAASQVIDPQSAAGVAGQAPALFKGTIGALEAVNLTLKAALASRLDFEQIARSLPQAAEGGSIAKATAEETLAVLSVLASEFKSGETAADRIKMFATRAGISEEFAGQGIVAVVEQLQAMDDKARRKYLGDSQELNVAYVKLAGNIDLIKQRIAEFEQERVAFAAGGGLLAQQVGIAGGDSRSIALINEARSRQALEAAQVGASGQTGAAFASGQNIAQAQLLSQSLPARILGSITTPIISGIGSLFGFSPNEIGAAASQFASSATSPVGIMAGAAEIAKAAEKLSNSADKLDSATARMGNTTPSARAQAAGASQ